MYVLVGDAELDEGSNNEAIVYAGAVGLPNLTVVAVDNQSSSYGWGPGGIEAHFSVERVVGDPGVRAGPRRAGRGVPGYRGGAGWPCSWSWPRWKERVSSDGD